MEENQRIMYEHVNYSHSFDYGDGKQHKTIVIHIPMSVTETTFDIFMSENVIVDKSADVYLDSFTTFNCKESNTKNNMGFILRIDELETKSVSNNSSISRSVFIPNEQNNSTDAHAKTHKGKKMNYISTLTPKSKFVRFSGSIKMLDGTPIFNPETAPDPNDYIGGAMVIELVLIDRKN